MIAVGSDDANPSAGGKVQIYEYSDNTRYPSTWVEIRHVLFFVYHVSVLMELPLKSLSGNGQRWKL